MKTHTTHPTQHAACGAPSFVVVVSEGGFPSEQEPVQALCESTRGA